MAAHPLGNTHSIKLKGPWSVTLFTDDRSGPEANNRTVRLPADWRSLFGETAGRAVFERRFNRPTGLTDGHRVRILFREVAGTLVVRLNDEPLSIEHPNDSASLVEITGRMRPHNQLSVEIECDSNDAPHQPRGLWQPVLLQIEEPGSSEAASGQTE